MEDFTQELVEVLKGMAGPDIRVILMEVTKANDQTAEAVSLIQPKRNVSRLFYPKEFQKEHCMGRKVKEIAAEIFETFQNDTIRAELELKLGILDTFNFDRVKRQLCCRLVNYGRSRKYLENRCFVKWLDLAVCFYILAESGGERRTIMDVTGGLRHAWEVSEQELLETAFENLCNDYPAKIEGLDSMIEDYMKSADNQDEFAEYMNLSEPEFGKSMHVLTNAMCADGAIAICYPDILKNFAESQGAEEVIIFPASIHEVILLPKHRGMELDAGYCSQIIRTINAEKVLPEEVLSDHAYLYSRKSDEIKIFE